jgi:rod shape-determining protein MreC
MKDFLRKNGIWVVVASLLLTAAISLGTALFPELTNPLGNLIGIVANPFQRLTSSFTGWVEGMYDYAFRYKELQSRVEELEVEIAELNKDARDSRDALAENDRLRELLKLAKKRTDFTFEAARVTGASSTSWESTLTLSKGKSDGIDKNDAVITETGYLVGVVAEAGTNWCTVITVLDPDISMGALVYRTGENAILQGDLSMMLEGACKLSYLDTKTNLISGDEVLTSGKGGVYPSGLVIGHVREMAATPEGTERYAVVQPAVKLDELVEVFVIKDFEITD